MRKLAGRVIAVAAALGLLVVQSGCNRSGQDGKSAASGGARQIELDRIKARIRAEGTQKIAREASQLEFWLQYKMMQANGMEKELGGEAKTVATLKAIGLAFERRVNAAQTNVPRLIPASFDGSGLDAGMMGVGYGLVGGALTSGMLSGGLSNEQIAEAAAKGPIKFDDADGAAQIDIAQGGMDTALEQTVNENGVTGKVKTKIHLDACPDAEGKLTVTIETESRMSAGGKSGAVTVRYRQERYLDDDANLLPIADGDQANAAEFFQIDMKGTGANGDLSYYEDGGFASDGKATGGALKYSGYSAFRPAESAQTQKMVSGMQNLMRAFAQMMLDGTLGSKLSGQGAPWESGRCVDLKVRSDPGQRTGAKPDTTYTLVAEPRAKADGRPTGGTVKPTLNGERKIDPTDKVKADAKFTYVNPGEKDKSAKIDFEARSKRGVGKTSLDFDTKKGRYRIAAISADGTCAEPFIVDDITKPFTNKICGGQATWTHTPTSDKGGNFVFRYVGGRGSADMSGTYTLQGPEDEMIATYKFGKICGHAAGMTACAPGQRSLGTKWTRITDGQ